MNVLRVRHLENALTHWERSHSVLDIPKMSLDSHLRSYYRAHKSKLSVDDKEWLSEKAKDIFRWQGLLKHFTPTPWTVSSQLRTFFGNESWRSYANSKTLEDHVRLSMPESLFEVLRRNFGKEKASSIASIWNESSPTFVRVNTLVEDRDRVLKHLSAKKIFSEKTLHSSIGLKLSRSSKISSLSELKEHVFDMQDESSQIVGMQVQVQPGDKVLDFCAGSGGKSLVFGPNMAGKGHLFLHDVNQRYLMQARQKLRNAKIRNFTLSSPVQKRSMDWILIDVPSTGTGSFRRYPDRKWLFTNELLEKSIALQREIFAQALPFLKKRGKIVYATASILPEENMHQVQYFCDTHKMYLSGEPVHALPQSHGMDGFFSATLEFH